MLIQINRVLKLEDESVIYFEGNFIKISYKVYEVAKLEARLTNMSIKYLKSYML